jgi:hypothetical protein
MLFVGLLFIITAAEARNFRVNEVPNGSVNNCLNCHFGAGGPRNDMGKLIEASFLTASGSAGHVIWGPLLASLDADGDGISNGDELQDPYGLWSSGDPAPGFSSLVTNAGNDGSGDYLKLTVNFSGMTPHVGQTLYLRLVDKASGKETARTETVISAADFNLDIHGLLGGHSYYLDFFSDHNGNELYDTPPADHAWRLDINDVDGDETTSFAHNTDFVDISWLYELRINFSDMTPHVGQLLEIRVVDTDSDTEVARHRVESIASANYTVNLAGLQLNGNYSVDMYADLSGNMLYDAPPVDHAWRESFTANSGDHDLDFSHSTTFTDVEWPYLFTLNLVDFTPHVGQLFELRLVDDMSGDEIGRVRYDELPGAVKVISIPGLQLNGTYRADFYADLNGNGGYDAPPADHAWRINFTNSMGNHVESFGHNTNFTNLDWPTSIIQTEKPAIANGFDLSANYPNPFNPDTQFDISLPGFGRVRVDIFNALGQQIRVLLDERLASGTYAIRWDGRDNTGSLVQSGTYFYRLTSPEGIKVRKMILLK